MSTIAEMAASNFALLSGNKYPGRIVFAGKSSYDKILQGIIITVRSKENQNRALVPDDELNPNGRVRTVFADRDAARGTDPTNILYLAMSHTGRFFMTTNGQHTEVVHSIHHNLASSLMGAGWGYEKDSANTPRIAVYNRFEGVVHTEFAVLKRSPFDDSTVASNFYFDNIPPGFGFYVSTYERDGNPPPSWVGEPRLIPLIGLDLADITDSLWNAMDRANRVSIAIKEIDPETVSSTVHIINAREIITTQP
jgi:IMP cyclohydrolase